MYSLKVAPVDTNARHWVGAGWVSTGECHAVSVPWLRQSPAFHRRCLVSLPRHSAWDCGDYSGNGTGFARRISGLSCQVKNSCTALRLVSHRTSGAVVRLQFQLGFVVDKVKLGQTKSDGVIVQTVVSLSPRRPGINTIPLYMGFVVNE
jgi:hypothetical protein